MRKSKKMILVLCLVAVLTVSFSSVSYGATNNLSLSTYSVHLMVGNTTWLPSLHTVDVTTTTGMGWTATVVTQSGSKGLSIERHNFRRFTIHASGNTPTGTYKIKVSTADVTKYVTVKVTGNSYT